jgi:ABC-type microcin C transport system duplicated ATPase subunit YejF
MRKALRDLRRKMQIIFQDPFASLDPKRTVGSQIEVAYTIHGLHSPAERRRRVEELLGGSGSRPPISTGIPTNSPAARDSASASRARSR